MNFHLRPYLIFGVLFAFSLNINASLHINEILASNNTTNYDNTFYNFSDWIEIYNDGSSSVNLNGYTITDDINIPDKYLINFSLRIDSRGYGVIWADKESWYPHANFALDSDGEFVALFAPDGTLVDSFSFSAQLADVSYGRYPDGSSEFVFMPEPTCSKKNLPGIIDADNISDSVIFSQKGGFYTGQQSIELSTPSPGASIRYTSDGSCPDSESEIYTSALSFSSNKVIRARSFDPGQLPGPVKTETYFIDQEANLPVLSISTNPDYFFSYTYGIYVVGTNGIEGNCIDSAVNFNQPWERAINFEYFSQDGQCMVNQVVGTKIAGRCSRTRPMKPLAILSREKYGKEGIDGYQFFNSKNLSSPKNLYLRNSGTEAYSTYLRDGFMQTLIMDRMDMDYQAYQPLVLYINGKYWGLYNLREKMDENYVASNYGIDPESIDLLEYNTIGVRDLHQGDWVLYDDFLDYVSTHDLSIPEHYEYVKSQMDVDEFMNIHIANIYFENEDWPNNNNKFWRERGPNGKWRWYMYDLDFGFGYWPKSGKSVEWFFGDREDSKIAFKIKSNPNFRNEFVQRMASHLNTTFKTERVLHVLDSVKGNLEGDIQKHIDLWGNPWSVSKWESNVQVMIDFTYERTAKVIPQIVKEFDLTGTYDLELENVSPGLGKIEIAGVDIPNEFTGFYFKDIPLRIQALPKPGYKFSGWSGDISGTENELFLMADSDRSIIAHFEEATPIENLYINEFLASNVEDLADENNEHEDWIEIYNDNDYPLDLAGLYLSDSLGELTQAQIPFGDSQNTIIPAKGYKLLWADKDPEEGSLHLSFKLSKGGEKIYLSQQIGLDIQIIDSLSYGKQYDDFTYGRDSQDPDQWIYLYPTPEGENQEKRLENIFINEFMASNCSVIQDEDGSWDDWIEIYNANDYPVDIAGMFISDDYENLTKFRIPGGCSDSTTIPGKAYLVLWADDSTEQGILHLNFGLKNSGEQILLGQANGREIMDSISYPELINDAPYGRTMDGAGHYSYLLGTPGASNEQPSFEGLFINEIMASNQATLKDPGGGFDDWIELYNDGDKPLNVGGLFLSDNLDDQAMFRISTAYPDSTIIPAKGHLLVWADDSTEQGILHASFKLDGNGEQLILSSTSAETIIDSLSFDLQHQDISVGRISDGNRNVARQIPTPGIANHIFSYEGIIISEVMASDHMGFQDDYGEYEDWIELYNGSDSVIDIAGMVFSDSLGQSDKYFIPGGHAELTSIQPDDFLVLWADDSTEQGALHLGFGLREGGEQVGIFTTNGNLLDSVSYPNQYNNFSYSRFDSGVWMHVPPSPGEKNVIDTIENLYINEYMSDNENRIMDEFGAYDDWIEIYNDNPFPVNLAGLYLSDSLAQPDMYRIPSNDPENTMVPAKAYVIFWADGENDQGSLHTNFKLSRSGEDLVLSAYDYRQIIDSISFKKQYSNFSSGKLDNLGPWHDLPPSPGRRNMMPDLSSLFINEVMPSSQCIAADNHGEYDDWIELYNGGSEAIDVGGLFMSDSLGDPEPFRISSDQPDSTTIKPKQFLLIWADDSTEQGVLHCDFKLSGSGEQVVLFSYDGLSLVDSLSYPNQHENFSYSRLNQDLWMQVPPTPGKENVIEAIGNLSINEYMSDNENRLMDEFGEYDDWIEIYNHNPFPVNLAGLYLSDSLPHPNKYRIPSNDLENTIVPAKEYVIIWTDGDNDQGPLHTNFKLSRSGEDLVLSAYDYHQIIDSLSFQKQYSNFSSGRLNEYGPWIDLPPTPGRSNLLPDLSHLYINEIMTMNMGVIADNHGEYDDWIEFYNGGTEAIDIGGLFITDSIGDTKPFRISSDQPDSTTIQAMQFLLIWADDSTEQGVLHSDFKLSRSGEQVAIYSYDGRAMIDSVSYKLVPRSCTFGRSSDGDLPWVEMGIPTPLGYNMLTGSNEINHDVLNFSYEIYPNPASDKVLISMSISEPTEVFVKIYDQAGKLVALPVEGFFTTGEYLISWNLDFDNGLQLGAGIYFYVIGTNKIRESGKLIIVN